MSAEFYDLSERPLTTHDMSSGRSKIPLALRLPILLLSLSQAIRRDEMKLRWWCGALELR